VPTLERGTRAPTADNCQMPLGRFPDASVSIGPDPGRTLCISLISSPSDKTRVLLYCRAVGKSLGGIVCVPTGRPVSGSAASVTQAPDATVALGNSQLVNVIASYLRSEPRGSAPYW